MDPWTPRHAELKDGMAKAGLKEIPPDLAAIMDGASDVWWGGAGGGGGRGGATNEWLVVFLGGVSFPCCYSVFLRWQPVWFVVLKGDQKGELVFFSLGGSKKRHTQITWWGSE